MQIKMQITNLKVAFGEEVVIMLCLLMKTSFVSPITTRNSWNLEIVLDGVKYIHWCKLLFHLKEKILNTFPFATKTFFKLMFKFVFSESARNFWSNKLMMVGWLKYFTNQITNLFTRIFWLL